MKISKFYYQIFHNDNKRIVVLSDIHYYHKKNMKKLNRVLDDVKNCHPDYICIPGDMIDERHIKDEQIFLDWLVELKNICPVIISLGNHEFIKSKKDYFCYDYDFFDKISKIDNIYFLDNKSQKIGGINFTGITLPGEYYYDEEENNKEYLINYINKKIKVKSNSFNVLLCHSPIELIKKDVFTSLNMANKIDLVICGHMHGGITPNILKKYLKGRGLISPHRDIFVKHSYGEYNINNTKFVISSGITKSSYRNKFSLLDFLFAPEITIIDIIRK